MPNTEKAFARITCRNQRGELVWSREMTEKEYDRWMDRDRQKIADYERKQIEEKEKDDVE